MSIFLRLYDYFTQPIQVFYLISDHITILRSIYHFKVHLHLRFHHHRSPLTSKYSTIIFPEWASCSFISVLHHIHLLSSNRHSLPLPFIPCPSRPQITPTHTYPNTHLPLPQLDLILNARTRLLPTTSRLGTIAFIGPVPSLPGPSGSPWVGVILDEPQGKNDGCAPDGTRYFSCESNRGVFVRPDRCEVGEWEVRGLEDELDGMGEEDEEI